MSSPFMESAGFGFNDNETKDAANPVFKFADGKDYILSFALWPPLKDENGDVVRNDSGLVLPDFKAKTPHFQKYRRHWDKRVSNGPFYGDKEGVTAKLLGEAPDVRFATVIISQPVMQDEDGMSVVNRESWMKGQCGVHILDLTVNGMRKFGQKHRRGHFGRCDLYIKVKDRVDGGKYHDFEVFEVLRDEGTGKGLQHYRLMLEKASTPQGQKVRDEIMTRVADMHARMGKQLAQSISIADIRSKLRGGPSMEESAAGGTASSVGVDDFMGTL